MAILVLILGAACLSLTVGCFLFFICYLVCDRLNIALACFIACIVLTVPTSILIPYYNHLTEETVVITRNDMTIKTYRNVHDVQEVDDYGQYQMVNRKGKSIRVVVNDNEKLVETNRHTYKN